MVHPGKGAAVLFYNLLEDGNSDELSLHGSLPVQRKVVPKLRSVSSMVIAPARTGTANSNKKAVTSIAQANNGIL